MQVGITTQFCFDLRPVIEWLEVLESEQIDLPISLGLAGPTKLQTLIRYAIMCGVGPSISVLKKRAKDLTKLLLPFEPTEMVDALNSNKKKLKNLVEKKIRAGARIFWEKGGPGPPYGGPWALGPTKDPQGSPAETPWDPLGTPKVGNELRMIGPSGGHIIQIFLDDGDIKQIIKKTFYFNV